MNNRALKVGCPEDPSVFMGALNSKPHLAKVRNYIKYAIEDGGKIECGEGVDVLNIPEANKDVRI